MKYKKGDLIKLTIRDTGEKFYCHGQRKYLDRPAIRDHAMWVDGVEGENYRLCYTTGARLIETIEYVEANSFKLEKNPNLRENMGRLD